MIKKSKLTRLIMTGAILALTGTTNAQSLDFYKKYKVDEVNLSEQVKVSADSNLLLLGTIRRANSLGQIIRDMLLVKTDLSGDTLWTKYIGLDDRSETGRDFEILDNGNMLITGFSAYDMGSKVKGFLMCVDAGGNLLWDKYYGNETDIYAFTSLKIVEDGVILAGTIDNGDNSDALILKTTMTGDSLWSTTVGGAEYDDAWDVETAPDGGFLFTGGTYSFADGAFDDAWIVKLDAAGNYLWRKTFGIAGRVDWAWSFVPSYNDEGVIDGYVFTGIKDSGEEGTAGSLYGGVHFVKVDINGELIWDKSLDMPLGGMRREGTDIIATSDGGYAICGYGIYRNATTDQLTTGLYFIKTDAEGNIGYDILTDSITESFIPRALVESPDSTFYITGTIAANVSAELEIFLAHIGTTSPTTIKSPVADASIFVYPNPAKEHITVRHGNKNIDYIDILSIDGKLLNSIPVHNIKETIIPVAAYSGTSIVLRTRNKEGACLGKKIVIL